MSEVTKKVTPPQARCGSSGGHLICITDMIDDWEYLQSTIGRYVPERLRETEHGPDWEAELGRVTAQLKSRCGTVLYCTVL